MNASPVELLSAAKVSSAVAAIEAAVKIASVPPLSPAVKSILPISSPDTISSSSDSKFNTIGKLSPVASCDSFKPTSGTCVNITSWSLPN